MMFTISPYFWTVESPNFCLYRVGSPSNILKGSGENGNGDRLRNDEAIS